MSRTWVRTLLWLWLTLAGWWVAADAVVINEVLVNEPSTYQNQEWLELYNPALDAVSLDDCSLTVDGILVLLPGGLSVPPDDYLIICRRLVSKTGASFEGHWGDSSGVWGDTEEERQLGQPVEAAFNLKNSGGTIRLYHGDTAISEFSWTTAGPDGVSWERIHADDDQFGLSEASAGSTPGRRNSVTPVSRDLAILAVESRVDDSGGKIRIIVANRGLEKIAGSALSLSSLADSAQLGRLPLVDLLPGAADTLTKACLFQGERHELRASLPDDDRIENNAVDFWVAGISYPRLIITELMVAPKPGGPGEWLEIFNDADVPVGLAGWRLSDPDKECAVLDSALLMAPSQYLVLVEDALDMMNFYPGGLFSMTEPACWPTLNNNGDTIRMTDPFGIISDRFAYSFGPADGRTLALDQGQHRGRWGRSQDIGGTPGAINSVFLEGSAPSLRVSVEPKVFSPDGDGVDDSVLVHIEGPVLKGLVLRLYDREGRVVHRFATDSDLRNDYGWSGCTEGGMRLPIGIYILHCELSTGESVKVPVVIAR